MSCFLHHRLPPPQQFFRSNVDSYVIMYGTAEFGQTLTLVVSLSDPLAVAQFEANGAFGCFSHCSRSGTIGARTRSSSEPRLARRGRVLSAPGRPWPPQPH